MLDADFKRLRHSYQNYELVSTGGELIKGYKPDVVLKKENNYLILESEHSTSRKHILGGMIKAAKFLSNNEVGRLVFVLQVKKNTTVQQIQNHLSDYLIWIKPLSNLRDVYIIADVEYCKDKSSMPLELFCDEFHRRSFKV